MLSERLGHTTGTDVVAAVYGKTFAIPHDFELFKTSLPFNGSSLSSKLLYKLHFVSTASFLDAAYAADDDKSQKNTKNSDADYKVGNVRLRFTKITSEGLSTQVKS